MTDADHHGVQGARGGAFLPSTARHPFSVHTVDAARRLGKALAKACRRLGDDVQLHVGLEAAAAALGFCRWNDLVAGLDAYEGAIWSDSRCRVRMLELVPDMADVVADGAIASLHDRPGLAPCP